MAYTALTWGDRIMETCTCSGTSNPYSLAGAETKYQAFSAVVANLGIHYYAAVGRTSGSWEVGLGTYTSSGDTLARTKILSSSNSNNAVNWTAETIDIWGDVPAAYLPSNIPQHGIVAATPATISSSTLTVATSGGVVSYYFQGQFYSTTSNITLSLGTLTRDTLYYVYFADATGVLTLSTSIWNLNTAVPVCLLFQSSQNNAISISNELHGSTCSIPWHIDAHKTIGCRYVPDGGFSLTNLSGTGASATWSMTSGEIYDEDLEAVIGATTQASPGARVWYINASGEYTFTDQAEPFIWDAGTSQVQYVNSGTNTLTDMTNGQYINMWAYATPDLARPIYFLMISLAAPYTSAANARLESPPNLVNLGLNPEMKLLYRIVVRGNGTYNGLTTPDDYRTVSSLPGGGAVALAASAVSYNPIAPDSASNVQAALDERPVYAATRQYVTQTGHGFSVGNILKISGSSTYALAQADSAADADVVGMVSTVVDANDFVLTTDGYVTGLSGLTAATTYFLSTTSAGAMTATDPNSGGTAGQVSKPVFEADSTTSGYFHNYRGMVLTTIGNTDLMTTIISHFYANTDPVDFVDTSIPNIVILGFLSSQNAASYKSATNATYTVPSGKTLSFLFAMPTASMNDATNRRCKIYNSTASADMVPYTFLATSSTSSNTGATTGLDWAGDSSTPSSFSAQATAGQTVVVQLYNADTSKRAMGAIFVCMIH